MSRRAKKAYGGHWELKRKQREAEKVRDERDMCRHSDDFRFFDSKSEMDAWALTAEPVVCSQCGKPKLVVATYASNRPGARRLHLDEAVDALIDGFIVK